MTTATSLPIVGRSGTGGIETTGQSVLSDRKRMPVRLVLVGTAATLLYSAIGTNYKAVPLALGLPFNDLRSTSAGSGRGSGVAGPATRVEELRRLGFTIGEIARLVGVSRRSVHAWMKGGHLSAANGDRLALVASGARQLGLTDLSPENARAEYVGGGQWHRTSAASIESIQRLSRKLSVVAAPRRVLGSRPEGVLLDRPRLRPAIFRTELDSEPEWSAPQLGKLLAATSIPSIEGAVGVQG